MTPMDVAEVIVAAVRGYLVFGLVFGTVFVLFIAQRLDPAVPGSTWGFRLMILPGVALLWPLLLLRVARGRTRPIECNAHRTAAFDVHAARLTRMERES